MEKRAIGNFCASKLVMIGYPDDTGVKNVNGRPGAAGGPAALDAHLRRLKGVKSFQEQIPPMTMLKPTQHLETNLNEGVRLTRDALAKFNFKKDTLVAVGGGHDWAYAQIRAVREILGPKVKLGCINLDAHFDLRPYFPVMNSGAPFRRLIEEGLLDSKRLVEFGIQDHCNAPELWSYAKDKKIKVIPMRELRNGKVIRRFKQALSALSKTCDGMIISVDLDALSLAYAPGVSAPQAEGFTGGELIEMLELAGAHKKVFALGVFELAPALDTADLTARVAAQATWHFLSKRNLT